MSASSNNAGQKNEPGLLPPKQDRSRRTLERIQDAALELMEERGPEAATVSAIVERANASVGSFYARFPGKDDLVHYLQAQIWQEAQRRWLEALASRGWRDLEIRELVDGVVSLLVRVLGADHRRRQALGKAPGMGPEGRAHAETFHDCVLSSLTPLFLAREGEISHPEPRRAVELGYRFVVGALRESLELEEASTLPTSFPDPEDLGPELARLWLGYLAPQPRGEEAEEEGAVDFFDPWG